MPHAIPQISLPAANRQVLLTRRPEGVPLPGDFTLAEAPVPACGAGQVLVRNVYLSVDPAQRGWASAEANYSDPVPLGGVMRAMAVARVIESRAAGHAAGDFVYGMFGWQDYSAVDPGAILHRISEDVPLDAAASLLGINGVTAYLALTQLGRPRPGDTLVVSTAAGSVGSFVGQIGKTLGARCVGITGGAEKVARCIERYGYDAAFDYHAGDIDAVLKAQVPNGVDVYFDNVGGTILDTVLRRMNIAGRIVQCGTASVSSWNPVPQGRRVEREILTRRLVWSGFVVFDHREVFAEACGQLAQWWRDGVLTYDTDLSIGIDHAPGALQQVYAGQNKGKRLILVA